MPPGSLSHRWVIGGERSRIEDDDRAEATRALREMLSSGRLTKLMPMKVKGGLIETVLIEQEGPIAYVETTTLTKIFDEDANRCLLLHTDERPEQTRRIMDRIASDSQGKKQGNEIEGIILRHQALQRMLEPLPVTIPYATKLGKEIPSDRVEARRGFPFLLRTIEASALLHQKQRQRDNGAIVASKRDYQIAARLLEAYLSRFLGTAVSDAAWRFYERLKTAWGAVEFTTKDARSKEDHSRSSVSAWLSELHEAGLVKQVAAGYARHPAVWNVNLTAAAGNSPILPRLDVLFPPQV
jgi:hypothetical protein